MTKRHPANDWEWEDYAEESFQEWFNDLYGDYSLRSEWFFGDCEEGDVNQRKEILYKWIHSSFLSGYNMGRLHETKIGLTE
jgi:hypothetical protein